ncbi:hypothetical protein [Raineyella sp. W15-4]|uniref:hypothetical protein n=1 Tax=Raineyella sp. W15-4 TaxID=3081651 RepID=UPI002955B393|nr:hypothetical protein [Raineyella sp. W15-4]WOQ16720.1 hypothetical protein R0145_16165 [Raineyella sp. W15-4]
MSLRQTLAQVSALQREIEEQIRLIADFRRSNQDNMRLVTTELEGSRKSYDRLLTSRLHHVDDSLTRSSEALKRASDALRQVQNI